MLHRAVYKNASRVCKYCKGEQACTDYSCLICTCVIVTQAGVQYMTRKTYIFLPSSACAVAGSYKQPLGKLQTFRRTSTHSAPADYVYIRTYVRKMVSHCPSFWARWSWHIGFSFAVLCIPANFRSRLEHAVTALTLLGFVGGLQCYCTYVNSSGDQLLNPALKHFSTTANDTFHRTNFEATEPD